MSAPLLEVKHLVKHYTLPREHLLAAPPVVQALRGLSFALQAGRSLGVVGESGSGKSTLARQVMALEAPSGGQVLFDGQDLAALDAAALRRARAGFQMVFQDPFGSLDPRQTVGRIVAEPLAAQASAGRAEQRQRAQAMLDAVGLRASDVDKYPHEFSGGQRQRIAIARALVTHPRLIVADEPVSALDVSVQAQVLNLMQDLQDRLGVTYLFISHDLAVVDLVCDEVIVLYQGRAVEQGSPDQLFSAAAHPYTRALMDAVPRLRPGARRAPPAALPPWPAQPPGQVAGGCAYAPRCRHRQPDCLHSAPPLRAVGVAAGAAPGPAGAGATPPHRAACHHAERVLAEAVASVPS
ncbi:oligopeptide/dipeptide ABC transporter ATP-binding protein [Aquabacterium sp. OR-4]|uniref:oligopeptide/dipeptide ABC transporter ATP-binding protein n=1 Tax=Aquabacterium sp. OR-4 TaxID=2978127 RepID=UPI0028C61A99|nr:oligopeptide/dipeptide ABC transporter ATP-binding protein [Aquabacterium sp. OR-4]MDT7833578.1 ATP-binding cassette domain-containing protein [Aquabacterium sp. OR-4]